MKNSIVLLSVTLFLFFSNKTFSQDYFTEKITAEVYQKLKLKIEKQVEEYKKRISKKDYSTEMIEFRIDTFRIERMVSERMDIDYTTSGMNTTVIEQEFQYDKLMNKYYNKLLKLLAQEDKNKLILAQRAWLSFRDNEKNLIWTLTKEKYSGGGTIQSNIAIGSYSSMVIDRAIKIFEYYISAVEQP